MGPDGRLTCGQLLLSSKERRLTHSRPCGSTCLPILIGHRVGASKAVQAAPWIPPNTQQVEPREPPGGARAASSLTARPAASRSLECRRCAVPSTTLPPQASDQPDVPAVGHQNNVKAFLRRAARSGGPRSPPQHARRCGPTFLWPSGYGPLEASFSQPPCHAPITALVRNGRFPCKSGVWFCKFLLRRAALTSSLSTALRRAASGACTQRRSTRQPCLLQALNILFRSSSEASGPLRRPPRPAAAACEAASRGPNVHWSWRFVGGRNPPAHRATSR